MPLSDRNANLAVGGLILAIFALLFSALSEQQYNAERSQCGSDDHCRYAVEQSRYSSVPPVPGLQAPFVNQEAKREEWRNENDLEAQWETAKWTRRAAYIAFAGLFTTVIGIYLVRQTLLANRAAVDEAAKAARIAESHIIASERAWISIEMSLTTAFKFTADEGRITIRYVLENTGKTPANNVEVKAAIVPFAHMTYGEIHRITQETRAKPAVAGSISGHTLFPGKTFVIDSSLPLARADMIAEANKLGWPDMADRITPAIVGCVVYQSPLSDRYHQTGFVAHLGRRDPVSPNGSFVINPATGTELPLTDIRVDRSFVNGYAD